MSDECEHTWINDPMFEDGAVMMFTSMNGMEMRQWCNRCKSVRYITQESKSDF